MSDVRLSKFGIASDCDAYQAVFSTSVSGREVHAALRVSGQAMVEAGLTQRGLDMVMSELRGVLSALRDRCERRPQIATPIIAPALGKSRIVRVDRSASPPRVWVMPDGAKGDGLEVDWAQCRYLDEVG